MNRYNRTGGSNAFLLVFSAARAMVAAMMYGGAGVLARALVDEEVA